MAIGKYRRGIGVFSSQQNMEFAVNELRESGFPMDKVSVIAKDDGEGSAQGTDLSKKPGLEIGKSAKVGSITGTVLGLLSGLLLSASTLVIPGVGPIVAAGTIAQTLAATLAGGGIGAISGGLIGAFTGLGIPGDKAKVYSDRLSQGDYLVIIEGQSDEVIRAEMLLLNDRGIEEWAVYDAHIDDPTLSV